MNTSQISKWLRKTPQPAIVVVDDGKRIDVGSKGGKWTEVARTIEAMGATKLTALDSKGDVIRALIMDDDSEPEEKAKHEHRSGCPHCGVDLNGFAMLISEAYVKGSTAQKDAYHSIFEENTKLVRLIAERLNALEMAWQKALQNQARMITDMANADADRIEAEAEASAQHEDGLGGLLKLGIEAAASGAGQAVVANGKKGARK